MNTHLKTAQGLQPYCGGPGPRLMDSQPTQQPHKAQWSVLDTHTQGKGSEDTHAHRNFLCMQAFS